MQNQEKALEVSLEALTNRVQDLKTSLIAFLEKLEREHETLKWTAVLNNFALLSGQINMLSKVLKSDKTPALRNLVLLPLKLSQDRDEELEKMTEGRVPAFNHEVVPNYLRTKAEPEVEARELQLKQKAATITPEQAQKQINSMNKLVTRLLDMVSSAKDDWDGDGAMRLGNLGNSNHSDTTTLVSAVTIGRNLKPIRPPVQGQHNVPGPPGGPPLSQQQRPEQHVPMGKAPSAIKTNIKAGSSSHPYGHR
ncbi:mediator of RNA polymerase II transcription subunit 8-like isoform X2 [Acanthaster planci]|uniref:Mediator of RNA polymerase II transcription subunit 8 n=1 Tax=Acanthaster planci TaxID=133434 RepID=A0A8B7ZEX7_ACAPL|nr:mediator of RNA polymerase II transcription subunit 8-like isoform X2 [Acanthaster planci]